MSRFSDWSSSILARRLDIYEWSFALACSKSSIRTALVLLLATGIFSSAASVDALLDMTITLRSTGALIPTIMGRWFRIEKMGTVWLIACVHNITLPITVESGSTEASSSNEYKCISLYIILQAGDGNYNLQNRGIKLGLVSIRSTSTPQHDNKTQQIIHDN